MNNKENTPKPKLKQSNLMAFFSTPKPVRILDMGENEAIKQRNNDVLDQVLGRSNSSISSGSDDQEMPLNTVPDSSILMTKRVLDDDIVVSVSSRKKLQIVSDDDIDEPVSQLSGLEYTPSKFQTPASKTKFMMPATNATIRTTPDMNKTPATNASFSGRSLVTASEKKALRADKFKETNDERYAWLLHPKDANRRDPQDPDYDPRSLYIPSSSYARFTPFEKQFWEIKSKNWDTVVFFKKGKFFELYEKDADVGHQQFDLKLTDRVNMRMVGVPESSFEYWASQFIAKGHKVAKVEQLENAVGKAIRERESTKKEDKIIRRELTCVLTAGTLVDPGLLTKDMSTYCFALKEVLIDNVPRFGVCFVDTATAEFNISVFDDDVNRTVLETLIMQIKPKELVLERGNVSSATLRIFKNNLADPQHNILCPGLEFWDAETTLAELQNGSYFDALPSLVQQSLDDPLAMSAFGGLLFYLRSLKLDRELVSACNFHKYNPMASSGTLVLDGQTLLNLEIFENNDGSEQGTLFKLINYCSTAFGKRLFKKWVCHPLRSIQEINDRFDAVDDLTSIAGIMNVLSEKFKKLPDLERLISRIHAGSCKVKDFVSTLGAFQDIHLSMDGLQPYLAEITSQGLKSLISKGFPSVLLDQLAYFEDAFDHRLAMEQGCIRMTAGYDETFDAASSLVKKIEQKFEAHLQECKRLLGGKSIAYKDLGKEIFQLEVSVSVKVPKDWTVMSKTAAVNRYYNATVRSLVTEIQEAREHCDEAMRNIKARLYAKFDEYYQEWTSVISSVAQLDCLLSLAFCRRALPEPKCRPTFVEDRHCFEVSELSHPCIMQNHNMDFIPNDTVLNEDKSMILLTGPNMGGKSTLLRQTCIAVIMAQIGCYIPAKSVCMSSFDRIFTRIGANDNIMAGQSTFMVELSETSKILSDATPSSLVILDELGRGTSTFDGYAIALSVLWRLLVKRCLGLFSTHYGALTQEFAHLSTVRLGYMDYIAHESTRQVTFLYKLKEGVSPKSYGMNVAAMAGIHGSIITNAENAAKKFDETQKLKQVKMGSKSSCLLFMAAMKDVLAEYENPQERVHFIRSIWKCIQ